MIIYRNSRPEVFLRKSVLKICSKFTGEHPCQSVISIKLQSNFIEITLRHGCSPVNLLYIFRTPFPRNTSGWLLLNIFKSFRKRSCNVFLVIPVSFPLEFPDWEWTHLDDQIGNIQIFLIWAVFLWDISIHPFHCTLGFSSESFIGLLYQAVHKQYKNCATIILFQYGKFYICTVHLLTFFNELHTCIICYFLQLICYQRN